MRHLRPILALAALLCLPVLAEEAPAPTATPAPRAAAKKAAKKAKKTAKPAVKSSAPGAANLIVTRDAETGELRPATAAEREKLLGRRALVEERDPEFVMLPDGGVLVKARPEDTNYTVATRNPDGSLSYSCVHRDEAARQVASPAPAPKPVER